MSQSYAASASGSEQSYSEASIADIGRALRRKWRWVVIPAVLAFVASTLFVFLVTPRYTGEARILLQMGDASFTRPGLNDRNVEQPPQIDEQAVASQVQVILSRDLGKEAIRRLGLVGNPEFDPDAEGAGLVRMIKGMLGLGRRADLSPEERVLERFYDNLLVYPVGKSRIVAIEFRSKDAELAARAANTIAELYLGLQEDTKKDQARSASTWLGSNIDVLRKRVAEAEAKVEAFRARTGLITGAGTATLAAQQLSDLSAQLAQARATRSDAQAKAKLIRDTLRDGRAFDIPDVANNELIRRLLEQRVNLKAQLALEQRTLLPQHPRIKELNAQLADLEQQIRVAAERTVRTLENDAKIAGARVEALEAAVEQQKKVVAEANASEVQLRAMEREARIQREQLEAYLSRYRDAAARDTDYGVPPDARVVSRAVVPQIPSFPKKVPIIALSTLATLLLAMGAIVSGELLSSRGGAERTAEETTGPRAYQPRAARPAGRRAEEAQEVDFDVAPPAGRHAPLLDIRPDVAADPLAASGPLAAAGPLAAPDPRFDFASLVDRISRTPIAGRGRRLLVLGLAEREDVLRVSRGLGLMLARGTRTILLDVDADEETPVDAVPGLTDLVAGEASFADVISRDSASRLYRIAPGTLMNDALTTAPENVDVALQALDSTYGWVVCTLVGTEAGELMQLLAPRVDTVVLASDLDPTSSRLVGAYEALRSAGGKEVIVASGHSGPLAEAA